MGEECDSRLADPKKENVIFYDFGGQERFWFMHGSFLKGSSVITIVMDGDAAFRGGALGPEQSIRKTCEYMNTVLRNAYEQDVSAGKDGQKIYDTISVVIPVVTKIDSVLARAYNLIETTITEEGVRSNPDFDRFLVEVLPNISRPSDEEWDNSLESVLKNQIQPVLVPKEGDTELFEKIFFEVVEGFDNTRPVILPTILSTIKHLPYFSKVWDGVVNMKENFVKVFGRLVYVSEKAKKRLETPDEVNTSQQLMFNTEKISVMGLGGIGKTSLISINLAVNSPKDENDNVDKYEMTIGVKPRGVNKTELMDKGYTDEDFENK